MICKLLMNGSHGTKRTLNLRTPLRGGVALLLALLLLTTPCYAGGIAPDKQKHIGVAAGLNLAMEEMGVKKSTRYTILGTIFIGKEIYDHNKHNATHGHFGDIVADIGGVAISEGCIWLYHKTW